MPTGSTARELSNELDAPITMTPMVEGEPRASGALATTAATRPTAKAARTRRPPTRRRREARNPVPMLLLVMLIVAFVGYIALTNRAGGTGSPDDTVADAFVPGACVDGIPGSPVASVSIATCYGAHDAEILRVLDLPQGAEPYPGRGAITFDSNDACVAAFAERVGKRPAQTDMQVALFLPSETTWLAGDRQLLCVAASTDRPLVAPLA